MKSAPFGITAFIFLLIPSALAQHRTFVINPDASQVKMELSGTGHTTEGAFHVRSGSVPFDFASGAMEGGVVVNAGSGKTGSDLRDKRMTNEVLEASKFNEITFAPTSYTGALAVSGDSTIQVSGTFTLHGVAHPLTVPMQIHIEGSKMTAHTNFAVPYVRWGLKDPSIMFFKVAKEVTIDLTLIGSLQ